VRRKLAGFAESAMGTTMTERRSSARLKSLLRGRIHFNNRRSSIDCLVRDFTAEGAKLEFDEPFAMPATAELYLLAKGETYDTKVLWHRGNVYGVAFGADEATAEPRSGTAAADVLSRVRKLESQVTALQRKVSELQVDLKQRQGTEP
jgi:hypothetical protein